MSPFFKKKLLTLFGPLGLPRVRPLFRGTSKAIYLHREIFNVISFQSLCFLFTSKELNQI